MREIHINDTTTVANHRVGQPDLNEHQTVFGGRTLSIVDNTASIPAMRVARSIVVTGTIDHIHFLQPFDLRHALSAESYVTGIGSRSIEVFTKIIGEDMETGARFLGFYAFTTFIIQDANVRMPATTLIADTPEQAQLIAGYVDRKALRDQTRHADESILDAVTLAMPWENRNHENPLTN